GARCAERAPGPASTQNSAFRPPFRDVEIVSGPPPLRQDQIEPQRQWELERLADDTAAFPQKQILGGLLRDRRSAARFTKFVRLLHRLADGAEVHAAIAAESAILGHDHGKAQRRRNAI